MGNSNTYGKYIYTWEIVIQFVYKTKTSFIQDQSYNFKSGLRPVLQDQSYNFKSLDPHYLNLSQTVYVTTLNLFEYFKVRERRIKNFLQVRSLQKVFLLFKKPSKRKQYITGGTEIDKKKKDLLR